MRSSVLSFAMQHFTLQRLSDCTHCLYSLAFNYVWSEEEKISNLKINKDIKQLDWKSCQFIFSFDLICISSCELRQNQLSGLLNISTCTSLSPPAFMPEVIHLKTVYHVPWCFSIQNKEDRNQLSKVMCLK